MATALNTFTAAIVVLSLISGGFCECELSGIKISQKPTPFQIHGKSEYEVSITHDCICPQFDVMINCPGFETTEAVDPNIFKPTGTGDLCILNNGGIIFHGESIKFKYAWDTPFALTPSSARFACS